jgi:hypothetical protein
VFLDGASGTITARVKDPDGAGPRAAPQATDANPAFVALKRQIRSCVATPDHCSGLSERSTSVLLMALDWYMDNRQTASRAAALHWLNNVETWISNGYGFACDVNQPYCGLSSWSDWPAFDLIHIAQAYSLVRSEMTAAERTAFYQKIFNDDTSSYEDGCTNMLQRVPGAVATFGRGSSSVTGAGFSALRPGDRVYFRPSIAWATVASVAGDTALTLTGTPQSPLKGTAPAQAGASIYKASPWRSSSCGLVWMLFHHAYAPADTIGRVTFNYTSRYDAASPSINVSSTAGLPAPPFYILIPGTGEVMKVTGMNGLVLSVQRGQLNTTARKSQYPPRPIHYTRYVPNAGTGDYAHNLVIQKLAGALTAGLALADEGAAATSWVTRAADSWLTNTYPRNRDMWAGFTQGGSTNYGPGRQLSQNYMIVAALKNIPAGGSPSLDRSAGNWLISQTDAFLYSSLPNARAAFVPWGQPDIATTASYSAHQWAPIQTFLLGPSSDSARHWNYWQRHVASQYNPTNLISGANKRLIPFALMYWQESDASADYGATLPTAKAFVTVDGAAERAFSAWVSRTGWTSASDTLAFATAFSLTWTGDHIGTGAPGAYKLYKGGWLLSENGSPDRETGVGADTNMLLFGGAASLNKVGSQIVALDHSASGEGWAFARINAARAYSAAGGVTRALRHLVHFKKSGQPDYLVAYDTAAVTTAKSIGQNLHFDKTRGQPSTITTGLPDLVWTGPDRRLSTKIVLPEGQGVARTYTPLANSHRVSICASSDGSSCAPVTAAEFLLVHKPSTSVSDTMPPARAIGTSDSDFVGVEIRDPRTPSVAVFSRHGSAEASATFTTTHGGTARYVVTGLSAGSYDVTRDGSAVLAAGTVDSNGTLPFESIAGVFTIRPPGDLR